MRPLMASDGLLAPRPRYDLFYNYYVGPSVYGGQPAQLYVSPRPTPPFVGHTYITYQPLMPHEFLYKHCRCYLPLQRYRLWRDQDQGLLVVTYAASRRRLPDRPHGRRSGKDSPRPMTRYLTLIVAGCGRRRDACPRRSPSRGPPYTLPERAMLRRSQVAARRLQRLLFARRACALADPAAARQDYGCRRLRSCLSAAASLLSSCAANDAYRQSLDATGTAITTMWPGVRLWHWSAPPNAGRQTKWAWGVTNTQVAPISHQFGRNYPGPYAAGGGTVFLPTPIWPNSTDQFGVYYVRGPW